MFIGLAVVFMEYIKFIDLFAGIGGFRLAFAKHNCKCVFSSEINEECREVYRQNYGELPFGDITKINEELIPDFDILCAGFPCQPFSICGKKQGFDDTRGTLFFDVCRIIKAKKPKVVFLENVKYLKNHNNGNTLRVILRTLEELGYNISYNILDSSNFGAAQTRERIIIIGLNKEVYGDRIFNFNDIRTKKERVKISEILDEEGNFEILDPSEYTLLNQNQIKQQPSGLIFCGYRNKGTWRKGIRPNTEHLSRVHRQPNRIYSSNGQHPTIPSQETSGRFWIYDEKKKYVRKLTIRECYRLMGYPESFKICGNLGNAYKQCGNSVVVPMITEIAASILRQCFSENNGELYDGSTTKIRRYYQQQLFDIVSSRITG